MLGEKWGLNYVEGCVHILCRLPEPRQLSYLCQALIHQLCYPVKGGFTGNRGHRYLASLTFNRYKNGFGFC